MTGRSIHIQLYTCPHVLIDLLTTRPAEGMNRTSRTIAVGFGHWESNDEIHMGMTRNYQAGRVNGNNDNSI